MYQLNYYSLAQVRIPNGKYKGQKLTNAVRKNIPPKASSKIARIPVIILVRYKTAIATAISILMILSEFPIFFFIVSIFYGLIKACMPKTIPVTIPAHRMQTTTSNNAFFT